MSNAMHELKAPITCLKLHHSLIGRASAERQVELLAEVDHPTERLEHILADLLRLSRLSMGHGSLVLTKVYLSTLTELPCIQADEGLLSRVLNILLTNVVKYTPASGRIVISTKSCKLEGKLWIGIQVSDTGPGFLPTNEPHLFERFFRGQASLESDVPGSGLGLAIAKEIVDRHCGQIGGAQRRRARPRASFTMWLQA